MSGETPNPDGEMLFCTDYQCGPDGNDENLRRFAEELGFDPKDVKAEGGWQGKDLIVQGVRICTSECVGGCQDGPLVFTSLLKRDGKSDLSTTSTQTSYQKVQERWRWLQEEIASRKDREPGSD